MYTEFGAEERGKLNGAILALKSGNLGPEAYQITIRTALETLNNSRPLEGRSLAWAGEIISAYREIGKGLTNYLERIAKDKASLEEGSGLLSEIRAMEKEFSKTFDEYSGEDTLEKVERILRDLENMPESVRDRHDDSTITGKVHNALEEAEKVYNVMSRYDISNEEQLEAILKEAEELRQQAEQFERGI